MKSITRILGATALCFSLVTAWAGQTQHTAAEDDPESIAAEGAQEIVRGTSTDAGETMSPSAHSEWNYMALMNAADRNAMLPDMDEVPLLPPFEDDVMHPEPDHPNHSHQSASNSLDGVIDACSLTCLSCHDGLSASEAKIKTIGEQQGSLGYDICSHPIGNRYDKASSGNPALTPRAFLPPEILLPEGKIGCESCHNLDSPAPHFLIFSNSHSKLCLECHIK